MREPVRGDYRSYEIVSMPPPSSGGVHVVQILNTLEGFPIGSLGHNGAETIHLMAEAMKFAYADRSEYLGDPRLLWTCRSTALTSKAYAAHLLRPESIATVRGPRSTIKPGDLTPFESPDTTHFSVVDTAGNAVANTYTLNFGLRHRAGRRGHRHSAQQRARRLLGQARRAERLRPDRRRRQRGGPEQAAALVHVARPSC